MERFLARKTSGRKMTSEAKDSSSSAEGGSCVGGLFSLGQPFYKDKAMLVGGVAAFAKIAGVVKAAGGAKVGAAATAMTAAATAAMSGSKQEPTDALKQSSK
ncbi:hypothetical protein F0562_022835 [Nyssa sinensis]|uniref:Uncharacterized protein n=1 Tax=Nyssa sinensis TaxID=561372 RepID=A0A5J5BEW6_9ASTE|nr:hypothetical protein F0562_022835 [Nyssa sinensis]